MTKALGMVGATAAFVVSVLALGGVAWAEPKGQPADTVVVDIKSLRLNPKSVTVKGGTAGDSTRLSIDRRARNAAAVKAALARSDNQELGEKEVAVLEKRFRISFRRTIHTPPKKEAPQRIVRKPRGR